MDFQTRSRSVIRTNSEKQLARNQTRLVEEAIPQYMSQDPSCSVTCRACRKRHTKCVLLCIPPTQKTKRKSQISTLQHNQGTEALCRLTSTLPYKCNYKSHWQLKQCRSELTLQQFKMLGYLATCQCSLYKWFVFLSQVKSTNIQFTMILTSVSGHCLLSLQSTHLLQLVTMLR